jgi:hypothetical protein
MACDDVTARAGGGRQMDIYSAKRSKTLFVLGAPHDLPRATPRGPASPLWHLRLSLDTKNGQKRRICPDNTTKTQRTHSDVKNTFNKTPKNIHPKNFIQDSLHFENGLLELQTHRKDLIALEKLYLTFARHHRRVLLLRSLRRQAAGHTNAVHEQSRYCMAWSNVRFHSK